MSNKYRLVVFFFKDLCVYSELYCLYFFGCFYENCFKFKYNFCYFFGVLF